MRLAGLSRFQIAVHLAAWAPLAWLIWAWFSDRLTINPIQAATQRSGQFAIILLLLSLACTPLNLLFGFRAALKVRRALGLYAFLYATIHFTIFLALDYQFDWRLIGQTIVEKRFILVGANALLILSALAATSFDWFKKRMRKGWKALHRLVYLAGALVILHFAWARKGNLLSLQGDIAQPLLAGSILAVLLILRIPPVRRKLRNFPGLIR